MIELTRTHESHSEWKVKVLGVGGAGTHAVDRLTRDGLAGVDILAANTDSRALASAATTDRIILGQGLTRGLGAGGDPELGRAAAMESATAVCEKLEGASLVILLAGLGGGTGSGAAPCIAKMARERGSHVAVFATLPFSFEGKRRREQALEALDALRESADFVVCFENDRMPSVADPASGIEDAFEAVDTLLAQAVRAVTSMSRRRNVMHSGIDEIASTVSQPRSTALFGYGSADGEERARAAVARAFGNPLLDAEGAMRSVSRLWVYVAGGPDLRWSEVQTLMSEVTERISPDVRLFFGAAVDPSMAGSVSITLLAGIPGDSSTGAQIAQGSVGASLSAPYAKAAAVLPHTAVREHAPASPAMEEPPVAPPVANVQNTTTHAPVASESPAHEPPSLWKDFPADTSQPPLTPGEASLPPVGEIAEVQSSTRSVPTPPFELSKERRRESSAQQAVSPRPAAHQASSTDAEIPAEEEHLIEPLVSLGSNALLSTAPSADLAAQPMLTVDTGHDEAESTLGDAESSGSKMALRENGKRNKDGVQEQMRFEAPNRGGRFEKTDPTIVDGEDLDVPTFMRQRLPIE